MNNSKFKEDFGKLLNNSFIPSDVESKEYIKQIKPMEDLVRANTPKKLYRYRSCNELNIDSFDKDTIWAVNPSKFNDPHDSLFYANKDEIYKSICNVFTSQFRENIWHYYKDNNSLHDIFNKLFGDELVNVIKEKLSNINIEDIAKDELKPPSIFDISKIIDEARNFLRSFTKIACLSERIDNSLMWAHYSDYHKGFALEYDFSNNAPKCICETCNKNCKERKYVSLYPVIYSKKQYDATQFVDWYIGIKTALLLNAKPTLATPDRLYADKIFLNKSKIWKYECEWRLICDCSNNIGTDSIMLENIKPKAIYYGAQISSINKKRLMKLCENKNIKQYEMYIDHNSDKYGLKTRLISKNS